MFMIRAPGTTAERFGDRTLVVDEAGTEVTTLNSVGSIVWWALDGQLDEAGLADVVLAQTTAADSDAVSADVAAFLTSLVAAGLAVPADAAG